ncbi:hypothetical protein N7528_006152 [Penicillium herquei]|nr:hypothetical protein N7528_006152 [Penicillium herquei]
MKSDHTNGMKCDRVIPICTLCEKFRRSCIYEKQTRTPLTRRYLTEVENELARTEALLLRFMPEAESSQNVNFSEPITEQVSAQDGDSFQDTQLLHQSPELNTHIQSVVLLPGLDTQSKPHTFSQTTEPGIASHCLQSTSVGRHGEFADQSPVYSDQRTHGPSGLSLETPPSSNSFEWDERTGKPSGDKFVDGMASLTSDANEGGYLGVASGAALLRITDTAPTELTDYYDSKKYMDSVNSTSQSVPFALTSLGQLEPFVEAYFSLYHRSYPIVHEATFRAQFMEVIPRPSGNVWYVLLFVLSAVGAFTTSTQSSDVDIGLFEAAKARMSMDMLETGNLLLVQALVLSSNLMQKRNKPNSGYNYMGLARRIAMGIGLHKEFPTWEASLFTTEMRRRIWYCLYIFDVGAIITFSRPLDFPHDGIDVELPMNVHDSDITAGTKRLPQPANETTVYTHLRAQATFHMATSPIYSKVISSPFPSAAELKELDDRLIGYWLSNLPPYFQENVIQSQKFRLCHSIMRWRYRNFRIFMYRPFLVGRLMARPERDEGGLGGTENDDESEIAIERCLEAARESVELIANFWEQEQQSMLACWYGLYFLFQAILIPVICLRNNPQHMLAEDWRRQIVQAMPILESMAHLNPSSSRCLEVIRSLCGSYLDPSIVGWGPTEESPQTQLANLYPLMWPTLDTVQPDGMDSIL